MKTVKYLFTLTLLLSFANLTMIWADVSVSAGVKASVTVITSLEWLIVLFIGFRRQSSGIRGRLAGLKKGIDTVHISGIAAVLEVILLVIWFALTDHGAVLIITAAAVPLLALGLLMFSGVLRLIIHGRQIKLSRYVLLLMLWWVPVVNIFVIRSFYKNSKREYMIESARLELDDSRKESTVCATRYPILLVHGIFFRDWQLVNYWGRIPAALEKNGAQLFYGRQQSSLAIAESAKEVKEAIAKVIIETGAEKVNIIAHSKGGLDSRYAISCLGMDKYVASLTTINTPHKGCDMVDWLLKRVPGGIVKMIEKRYNRIFSKLGDKAPDFMAGVRDLSAERAKSYDTEMPDSPLVSYRSVMSVMRGPRSAGFPLNIGCMLIKKLNGANDGLVWEESAKHGSQHMLITNSKKRGISHGDVIDLMRENIEGFDVREFYVGLVSELKADGF